MTDSLAGIPEISSTTYDRLAVGDRFGPFTESFVQRTSDVLRGPVGTPIEGEHAPPGVLGLVTLRALRRALDGIVPGGVLTRQRFVLHADLPAAADVDIDVRVSDQARRPSGLYTTFTFALRHDDALAAVVEWTILAP